jgi:Amt family ammonium transporter
MLTSTALVLMMSVPALALFYGGMVRAKNMLSMLMQVFVVFSMVTVLWCIYGYSLAFTEGNAYFGGFSRLFLIGTFDSAKGTIRERGDLLQGRGASRAGVRRLPGDVRSNHLLPDLGAFAERARFSAVLVFIALWFTFSYAPIAHMVWFWMGPDAYTDRS